MLRAVVLLAAGVLASSLSCAAAGQGKYSLREDGGHESSRTRRVATAPLPFDKSYDELTVEEKATVRSEYTQLGENDEPPYPDRGNGPLTKVLAKIQQVALVTGQLYLVARIDEHGDAQTISVFKTPDASVAQAVASAIMQTKFKPGKCDGKVCAMDFPLQVSFRVAIE